MSLLLPDQLFIARHNKGQKTKGRKQRAKKQEGVKQGENLTRHTLLRGGYS